MEKARTKPGYTLVELLAVIAIIAILFAIGGPAVKDIASSFESSIGVVPGISAALTNARAIALKNGKYAGVRFQQDSEGTQYMILIIEDEDVGHGEAGVIGCRPVAGRKPMKLSVNIGMMDLRVKSDYTVTNPSTTEIPIEVDGDDDASNANIDDENELLDSSTFTVIFSKAGKMMLHTVKVAHGDSGIGGDIFNAEAIVDSGGAMFIEDENSNPVKGLQLEMSRNCFIIYDKQEFAKIDEDSRWTDFLQYEEYLYINAYSGEIVNK